MFLRDKNAGYPGLGSEDGEFASRVWSSVWSDGTVREVDGGDGYTTM